MLKVINIINILVLSLILCFVILFLEVRGIKQKNLEAVSFVEQVRDRTNRNLAMVCHALREKAAADAKHKEVMTILKGRENWIKLLNELNSVLPENIWLTRIESCSEPNANRYPSPFGTQPTPAKKLQPGEDIEWIEIEGHTLMLSKTVSMEQILVDNIIESDVFTDKKNELDYIVRFGVDNNNLSEFTIKLKLKRPIKW